MIGYHREKKKAKKSFPGHNSIINHSNANNTKFLELRKHKFWHLAEEKRRLFTPYSDKDAENKAYNANYVNVHSFPPISALRIKNHAAYSHITENAEVEKNYPFPGIKSSNSKDDSNDTQATRQIATQENLDNVATMSDPYQLMYITDKEQHMYKFTIEEKIGVPMYQEEVDIQQKDQSDVLKSKVFNSNYVPRRVVAPPE